MKAERVSSVADLVRGSIDPRRSPNEWFQLYSIPAYDAGVAETVQGSHVHSSKTIIQSGDLLFSKLNPRIPRAWLVEKDGRPERKICSTEFLPLRIRDTSRLLPEYLRIACLSPQFLTPIQAAVNSSTRSHQRIRPETLLEQTVPLPEISEQRRIVRVVREAIERTSEIKTLQASIDGDMSLLLVRTINALIRKDWPRSPLSKLCPDIRNGWSGKAASGGQEVFVLRLSCVHTLEVDVSDTKRAIVDARALAEFCLRKGDVFVVRGNGSKHLVGRSAIALETEPTVIFNDLLIRLRFVDTVLPRFANYMLHSSEVRGQIEALSKTAAGIWKINQPNLGLVEIPCPELSVQRSVAAAIDDARQIIQELSAPALQPDTSLLESRIFHNAAEGCL